MAQLGMVGTGAMGSSLLGRLRLAGLDVTVYDCATAPLEKARSMGAHAVSSAQAVAETSSIIDVVVRTDEEMLDCMLGEKGVLKGAKGGTLVLLHSTILPTTTKRIAEAARPRGVDVMDACMVGVPGVVQKGEVHFLVGGPIELAERARGHLLTMGKAVIHMGPLGAGNAAKLIKNLVTASETLILHEAIKIGEACGIKYCDALAMMKQVYSDNLITHWEDRFDPSGTDSTPNVGVNLFDKDLPLAGQVGRDAGVAIPITEQLVAAGLRLMEGKQRAS